MSAAVGSSPAVPRPLPPPRSLTAEALVRGLGSAQRLIGIASLLLTLALLIDAVGRAERWDALPLLLACWSIVLAAGVLLVVRPSTVAAMLAVTAGLTAGTGWVIALLALDSSGVIVDQYLLEALAWSLLFIGAVRWTAVNGMLWVGVALLAGTVAVVVGQLVAGHPVVISSDRPTDAVIMTAAYAAIGIGMMRGSAKIPALPAAADRTAQQAAARDRERAASALVHDTALASLTLIARSDGVLDERLRLAVRADLDALRVSTASSVGVVSAAPQEGSLAARLLETVDSFRWRGMRVDVSGIEVLGDAPVDELAIAALLGATTAALDNVRAHTAGARADLAIGRTAEAVTVMIVDSGPGFELESVSDDRLGVRQSILARVQRVGGVARVWSAPTGTTVMVSVPLASGAQEGAS